MVRSVFDTENDSPHQEWIVYPQDRFLAMPPHVLATDIVDALAARLLPVDGIQQDYDERVFLDRQSVSAPELAVSLRDSQPIWKEWRDDLVQEQCEFVFGHGAAGLRRAEEQFSADERKRVMALATGSAPADDRPVLCLRLDLLYRLKRRRDQGAEDHGDGGDSSKNHSLDHVQVSFRALRRFEAVL